MQLELMHESLNEALVYTVQALGGAKKVGAQMRPEMPADHAAAWVRDCLNPTRREKFSPDQVVWLLKAGREAGVHAGMQFLAGECGYRIQPIEPEEQRDGLIRDFLAAEERLQALARRMERIGLVRSAA